MCDVLWGLFILLVHRRGTLPQESRHLSSSSSSSSATEEPPYLGQVSHCLPVMFTTHERTRRFDVSIKLNE
uniref:Osteoligament factor n=1 Tax=Homo sapiens TaxID=9606 RepID=Q5K675_HUMAN|nr:osteoligament factor [Homo sapiens]